MADCKKCKHQDSLFDALESIVWYDGQHEWLKVVRDEMAQHPKGKIYPCPFRSKDWNKEPHVIWMLLVGMFGDCGASIRGGWIEKVDECIEFIDALCKESWEAEERLI